MPPDVVVYCPATNCANYNCEKHRVHVEDSYNPNLLYMWFVKNPANCSIFVPDKLEAP